MLFVWDEILIMVLLLYFFDLFVLLLIEFLID